MPEREEEPFLGRFVIGQLAITLTQQILQLGKLGGHGVALRTPRQFLDQACQAAPRVVVQCGLLLAPCPLQGQVGATTLQLQIRRVMPEGLLVDQQHLIPLQAIRCVLIDDPGVPLPRGPIVAFDVQVLAERLFGFFQVVGRLGSAGSKQQGRRIPTDSEFVPEMHAPAQNARDHEQDCQ